MSDAGERDAGTSDAGPRRAGTGGAGPRRVGLGLAGVLAVARKELRQMGRDRQTLLIVLFVPAFFLLVYGYALNFDIRNVPLGVQDRDRSSASRDLVSSFLNSGYFDLVADVIDDDAITRLLNEGTARAVLVVPERFGAETSAGRPGVVQLLVSGDNANTAATVVGYAAGLVGAVSARAELEARVGSPGGPVLTLEPRVWYNPELRSTLFLVPGLIAYIAMLTAVVSTALSVVREKEAGTMEQVRMSPIGPLTYVLGKTAPYFVLSLASAMVVVAVSMALFDLPMRGSWVVLLGAVSLFLVGALGFGLLISTMAETQQVAFQLALLTSYLPTLMLSGFIFPISSMPEFLQGVTRVVPARYFLVILRGLLLKGVGPATFWPELVALTVFAVVILGMASLRLRRQWA
jgi:ABC-2 type transport system permease protein